MEILLSGPSGCCQPNLPCVLREEEHLNTPHDIAQATLPNRTCALPSATRTWKAMEGLEGRACQIHRQIPANPAPAVPAKVCCRSWFSPCGGIERRSAKNGPAESPKRNCSPP